MEKIQNRIDEWKRKLVDLSRRNRLLHFRPTRGSTLRIVEPQPAEVFRRLGIQEKSWSIYLPPDADDENGSVDSGVRIGQLPLKQTPAQSSRPEQYTRHPTEIICQAQASQSIKTALRNIYRRSRADFDEKGVRTLHISFGALKWKETAQSDPVVSPILVIPVEISRKSARHPYIINPTEETLLVNPALDVKLTNDFHIQLTEVPDDYEAFDLIGYIREIESRVRSLGWTVTLESWLTLFSFHKLVMYKDLDSHNALVAENPLVRSLCDASEAGDLVNGSTPDPSHLDQIVEPKASYLIRDADSSQLACIEAVKRGASVILQGPPGTGKSQTIANMIAEAIAAGRSVLFMSEKMAALEVVYKRLREANLDRYCLELHSQKANKKQVIDDLYQSYVKPTQARDGMTDLEFQKLTSRRQQLNSYVLAAHQIREPLVRSVFDVLGELAELSTAPAVAAPDCDAASLSSLIIDTADQLAHRLSRVWKVAVEGPEHPWCGCVVGSFTLETRTQVSTILHNAVQALKGVMTEATRISKLYESDEPHTHQDIAWMLQVAELLKDAPVLEENWITDESFPDLIANARKLKEQYAAYHSTRKALVLRYTDSFFELTEDSRACFESAVDTLSRLIGADLRHEATTLSYASQALRNVQALITYCKDWEEKGKEIAEFLEVPPPNTLHELTHVLFIEGLCRGADPPDPDWMETRHLEEVERTVPSIQADFESRARYRAQLLTTHHESIYSVASTAAQFAESLRVSIDLLGLEPAARSAFINHLDQLLAWAKECVLLAKEWAADATVISHTLGLPVDIRIEALPTFIRIAELCDSPDRPAREWFDAATFSELRQFLPGLRRDYEARQAMRAAFCQQYDDRLLTQDLDRLISDLSGRYASWPRWLKPGFYRFRRGLRQYRRDGECPADPLKDLLAGRDLLRIERRIQEWKQHPHSGEFSSEHQYPWRVSLRPPVLSMNRPASGAPA